MKKKQGFTLVETLVAVTVLVIGVLGPLAMAARGISDGLFAQNQLTANMLAQEAMEVIINYRNGNVLDGRVAFEGLYNVGSVSPATLDINGSEDSISLGACSGALGCNLIYDENKNYYITTAGPGQFARKITTTPGLNNSTGQPQELKVEVLISWKNRDVDKDLTVVEYLYAD